MLSVDGTFLIIFASFVLFMFLMKGLYFGPLLDIKNQRESTIEAGQKASEDASTKSSELNQKIQQEMQEARRKAQLLIQEKRDQVKVKATQTVSQARQKALDAYATESSVLTDTKESVYSALQTEREALAQSIVQKLQERQAASASS